MSDEKKIGYAWRVGCQTAEGITIDVTGNFPVDAPNAVINTELDKWIDIFSRQRAKTVLIEEERLLKDAKLTHASLLDQIRKESEKTHAKTSEKQSFDALKTQCERVEAQIAQREAGIASLKLLV
jgi:hypothetical protein